MSSDSFQTSKAIGTLHEAYRVLELNFSSVYPTNKTLHFHTTFRLIMFAFITTFIIQLWDLYAVEIYLFRRDNY